MGANAIDLTTVQQVETYLNVPSSAPVDSLIQSLITGASQAWLTRTGLDSLSSVNTYTERYDGSGSRRQFVRNRPIISVSSLTISGVTIPPAPNPDTGWGFVIDQRKYSIALVGAIATPLFGAITRFVEDIQNVAITYSAGYEDTPADVSDKVAQMIAINYKRLGWLDQVSQQLQQAGTVSYRSWAWPPEVEATLAQYSRNALV